MDLAFAPILNTRPLTTLRGHRGKGLGERSPKGGFNGAKVPLCLGKKGRHAPTSGSDPRKDQTFRENPSFGMDRPGSEGNSKAPPRNLGPNPSGTGSRRSDGTWDPPERPGDVLGCLRSAKVPKVDRRHRFPSPGRDSKRKIDLPWMILFNGPCLLGGKDLEEDGPGGNPSNRSILRDEASRRKFRDHPCRLFLRSPEEYPNGAQRSGFARKTFEPLGAAWIH